MQHGVLVHDSVFEFGETIRFTSVGTLPLWKHVGQDDSIIFKSPATVNPGLKGFLQYLRKFGFVFAKI